MKRKKVCDGTRIWVHPSFRRKLKSMAGEADMSLVELTRFLVKKNEKKKDKFLDFEFKI